jgi:hypothetical protein
MLAHSWRVSPLALVLTMAGMQMLLGLGWLWAMNRVKQKVALFLGLMAGMWLLYVICGMLIDWSYLGPD